ncbi:MAG TPA: hypothetical protein VNA25_23605 [Phycisphaerae bacterium]|nr:hypothetical protein [Phycisphaerae bacterium]
MKCLPVVLGLLLLAGCADPQPYVTSQRLERGLVIVLPGIEGRSQLNRAICRGLFEGGVDCAIELYDWTSSWGLLYNLRATDRNWRKAEHLADKITRYRMACPGRPVFLVGQSGGGAIAVWTAERLGPGQKVDGIVLLAASLSPYYMLDMAIRNSRRGVVSFHSSRDWFLVGTNVTGTMDGEMTSSAGRTGFLYPETASRPKSYARLYQVPWDRQMARAGHTGGHLTSGAATFVAMYVAPLVSADRWDEESVDRVMRRTSAPASAPASEPAVPRVGRGLGMTRPAATTRPGPTTASAPTSRPVLRPPPSPATRPAARPEPQPAFRPATRPSGGSRPSRRDVFD